MPTAVTTYKVKSKQGYKTVSVAGPNGSKRRSTSDVKYVAFWSEKAEKRAERAPSRDRQGEAGRGPGAYAAATPGAARST